MTNPFITIVAKAAASNWCVNPSCTTCGALTFRSALRELVEDSTETLVTALSEIPRQELIALPGWEGAIEIAVSELRTSIQVDNVLAAWLGQVGQCLQFDDVVLFRILRKPSLGSNAPRERWIHALAPLAIRERDVSLVESLLLTLRDRAKQHPDLVALATEAAKNSPQMRRVLRTACGIDPRN